MNRLEDILGKTILVLIFGWLAYVQFLSLAVAGNLPNEELRWVMVAGRLAGFMFVALITFLTIVRTDPKASAQGWEPRLTSIIGTFCMTGAVVLPTGHAPAAVLVEASFLVIIGTFLSVWCVFNLGRSFSVMASARNLVVSGPYAHVRHPLYAAEAVTILGSVLIGWSGWSVLLGALWLAFQYRRMINEEAILSQTFPEYADYAAHTPRMIPTLAAYKPQGKALA